MIPNNNTDVVVVLRQTTKPNADGQIVTVTYPTPVIAWDADGVPMIAPLNQGGELPRLLRADTFDGYELVNKDPMQYERPAPPEPNPLDVVEIIPGSGEALAYTFPDGSKFSGAIPLWGRRRDGSLTPILQAESVPTVRTVERDSRGEIVAVHEGAE